MRSAIVIGNGLTISQQQYLGCELDSSSPFGWPVPMPGDEGVLLMDRLPGLKSYIGEQNPQGTRSDFEVIGGLISGLSDSPFPAGLPDDEQSVLLDACHFLAVGYGWFQNQVDAVAGDYDDWAWQKWMVANRDHIVGVLSWNYDLTAERLLERSGRPFFYPGFVSNGFDPQGLNWGLPAVPVCKPHGSTNFSHVKTFGIRAAESEGSPPIEMTYPRSVHVCGYDGPMEALPRGELQTVRSVADVVLPGEWNRFENHVQWVGNSIQSYAQAIATAEHLLIVGFSMAECDRNEFERSIALATVLRRITIANPTPSDALIDSLRGRAPELVHWPDGPNGPDSRL